MGDLSFFHGDENSYQGFLVATPCRDVKYYDLN
jgi:hypothetical protein